MEHAYRTLISKLSSHELVERVKHNYYHIRVKWKNGFYERIVIPRDLDVKLPPKYSCTRFTLPQVLWWDELSNGKKINKGYLYDYDQFYEDLSDHEVNAVWKYKDFVKLGAYEQIIFIQELMEHIKEYGWQKLRFPEYIMRNSYQLVFNEDENTFRMRNGYKLPRRYVTKERPGHRIIEHFMPFGLYGKHIAVDLFSFRSRINVMMLFHAIHNLINANKKCERLRYKRRYDFTYRNIMKFYRRRGQRIDSTVKLRPISLYRLLINDFNLEGTFLDLDPWYGEKMIAAHACDSTCYYVPTCPFDTYADNIADFLGAVFENDVCERYDYAIADFNFKFDKRLFDYYMENYKDRVDKFLVFVSNRYIDQAIDEWGPPSIKRPMMVSREYNDNGFWLLYDQI